MQVLNIDNFAQVKRQLVFKGKTHDIIEVSVQDFIDNLKAAEELEGSGDSAPEKLSQQMSNAVDAICKSAPTLPRDEFIKRPVEVLSAVLRFIRGEDEPNVEGQEAGEKKVTWLKK